VLVQPLDLGAPDSLEEIARATLARAGAIDLMIHNAGVSQRAFASDTAYATDEALIRTNFLGPVALTKAVLPSMRARRRGHFVVITSVLGKFGLPGRSSYCAAKHALHGFFDTLRAELWADGILVTLVLPGWVRTNISINALTGSGAPQRKMDPGTASGYTPEFCAGRILAAAESGKAEINILRLKEYAALQLSRFAPGVFRRVIRGREL
jgi:short-subunit dehydrogenase